jgi:branched-chain amino acid transport system ATP-binding protein
MQGWEPPQAPGEAGRGRVNGGAPPISVDEVTRRAGELAAHGPPLEELDRLAGPDVVVRADGLVAGYGQMEILHGVALRVGRGQALCLIGPNGAGKSTVLHALYGLARVMAGRVEVSGRDVTRLPPNEKLRAAGVAYVLQDDSVFPEMTVEENLRLGGYLLDVREARARAEAVLQAHERLGQRRRERAGRLSGGERRLLELTRALMMNPDVLLVDEPSIGLEPRYIDMVFETLHRLRDEAGKTIVLVEQNAKKGLEFADVGYVLVAGRVALAGTGDALLHHEEVGRLFLGG